MEVSRFAPSTTGPAHPGTLLAALLCWLDARSRGARLEQSIELADESGADLSGDPGREPGDPIVRRRDGAIAYHLAGVVDDGAERVTRVVRGRDLAATTATQVALQQLLGIATPRYRHHLLLLERRGEKLAKLHGAVGFPALRAVYSGLALCGVLAHATGLRPTAEPVTPRELLGEFAWGRVSAEDRVLIWTGSELVVGDGAA